MFIVAFRGRLLVGTFVALSFNLFTMLSVRNKPFAYVSEGMILFTVNLKMQLNVLQFCFIVLYIIKNVYSEENESRSSL